MKKEGASIRPSRLPSSVFSHFSSLPAPAPFWNPALWNGSSHNRHLLFHL